MSTLHKKIENYIFGEISTHELLDTAFTKKQEYFGKDITYSPKVFIPLTTLIVSNITLNLTLYSTPA